MRIIRHTHRAFDYAHHSPKVLTLPLTTTSKTIGQILLNTEGITMTTLHGIYYEHSTVVNPGQEIARIQWLSHFCPEVSHSSLSNWHVFVLNVNQEDCLVHMGALARVSMAWQPAMYDRPFHVLFGDPSIPLVLSTFESPLFIWPVDIYPSP